MKTKLTLTIEKDLIEQAKRAARSQRTSISSLVENFLGNLCIEQEQSFSSKWLGAFKEPPHQRSTTLGASAAAQARGLTPPTLLRD